MVMRSVKSAEVTSRPVVRRSLACALAAIVLLPQACATASSPTSSHESSQPTTATSRGSVAPDGGQAKLSRPITVKVTPRLFGVHDTSLAALSHRSVGAIRLWDAGVTWRELEPQPGVFDFTRLDQIVELAHANHTEVTLVLAGTPAWAAADPSAATWIDPPRVTAYKAFATTVMRRYKSFDPDHNGVGYRGITNYQAWNEPNIETFWTGTLPQMASLVRALWQVRQQVDPGAKLLAPSMVTRLPYEMKRIRRFYALKVASRPVWRYVDATAFSLYPVDVLPSGRPAGPEDMMTLVRSVRATLAKDHVPARLPLWDTEINYGLRTGTDAGSPATPVSDSKQVAFVMRTFLLSAAGGLRRVFWYRYDLQGLLVNTFLTDPPPAAAGTLAPAGQAFYRIQRWMKGTLVGTSTTRPCAHDKNGTYTCVVRYGTGMGRIYWNPHRQVAVTTVSSVRSWETELGVVHPVTHRVRLEVGFAPVLVRSRR
jgi:hypothetical protein